MSPTARTLARIIRLPGPSGNVVLPVTRHEHVASLGMSTAGTEISQALGTTS
jgi:hypothetical protein